MLRPTTMASTTSSPAGTTIGRPHPLLDGRARVTGALRYTADLPQSGVLHARFVTSPHPHARIEAIDASRAEAMAGVVRVLTAADLPVVEPTSRTRLLLARERVMFVGQPVALVVAESEAAAADAAPEVNVTYTLLPAATGLESALAADAPLVWPEGATGDAEEAAAHGTDVSAEEGGRQRSNLAGPVSFRRGDPEAAFAAAHAVVERSYRTAIVHQSYIEPHATVVDPGEPAGGVTVWSCTQAQFAVRKEVADLLGLPESDVHVKPMPVGGGFGGKFMLYEPLVALAARAVGAPLRLVLTRQEEMLAAIPAPRGGDDRKAGGRRRRYPDRHCRRLQVRRRLLSQHAALGRGADDRQPVPVPEFRHPWRGRGHQQALLRCLSGTRQPPARVRAGEHAG